MPETEDLLQLGPPAIPGALAEVPEDRIGQQQMEDALRAVSTAWMEKIKMGLKHKRPFTVDAKESMNFFDGQGDWFWKAAPGGEGDEAMRTTVSRITPPTFRMTVNKAFEAVKLFGSVIYARNPVRTVTPKTYPVIPPSALGIDINIPPQIDPMTGEPMVDERIQQFVEASKKIGMLEEERRTISQMIETYLNYTPNELNLKEHSRRVVDEAIIKGLGVWWTEIVEVPTDDGEPFAMVGSFADSADNIVWDPDADEQEDIRWVARRCVGPLDELATKYELEGDDLRGHIESYTSQADESDRGYKTKKRNGKTNDLLVYWKVWSKTGFGHSLKGTPKEFRKTFDSLGENCYIVVAEGIPYPLNAPKSMALEEPDEEGLPASLFQHTRWPIPFYAEVGGWPFVALQFHRKPGYSWPISHLKPGIPELKFINWVISFLATRAVAASKTILAVRKAVEKDIRDQLAHHEENGLAILEISETLGMKIDDLVSILQMPEVSPEIWKVLNAVMDQFEKRVGLTELVFGMTRNQFRSAAEAQVKSEQISVRPDDMANVLEDAMSLLARREALAARWLLGPTDVAPVMGPLGAVAWESRVQTLKLHQVAREFDYRIEAGSARKPNKGSRVEAMQMAMQTVGPVAQGLLTQGVVGPWNALMGDWARALDIDPAPYLVPEPPPPPPPVPPPADPAAPPGAGQPPGEPGGGGPEPVPPQVPPEMSPQ